MKLTLNVLRATLHRHSQRSRVLEASRTHLNLVVAGARDFGGIDTRMRSVGQVDLPVDIVTSTKAVYARLSLGSFAFITDVEI